MTTCYVVAASHTAMWYDALTTKNGLEVLQHFKSYSAGYIKAAFTKSKPNIPALVEFRNR